jgi:hypothetical protein
MAIIKDPDWYLTNQSTPDKIYSNAIFFALGLYNYYNKRPLLGILFILLGFGSTLFHVHTNNETLLIDRITMVLVFSYFFNLFYPQISILNYSLVGLLTVLTWYMTEELAFFFLFQAAGLGLFLIYYPMDIKYKLAIIAAYSGITYSQIIDKGEYHSLKHLGLGALSLIFK